MKRSTLVNALIVFVLSLATLASPAAALAKTAQVNGPQTYVVMVGADRVSFGIDVMSFFPDTLRVHVGDTVLWKQNAHEIHTVTFLGGNVPTVPEIIAPAPGGGLMINPVVAFPSVPSGSSFDSSIYTNSGIMSTDPNQPTEFSLTFNQPGTFNYLCIIHNQMMTATIEVVDPSIPIPSPTEVSNQAARSIRSQIAQGMRLIPVAYSQVPKPVSNPDGTKTFTVLIGFTQDHIDLMGFFPKRLVTSPGDTVNFTLSDTNDAPHTVTFLNGGPDIPFVIPTPNPNPPPDVLLIVNPDVLAPINPGQPLTNNGVFSSGLLAPGSPNTSYSLTIGETSGDFPYECLLHDTSGMTGLIKVVAEKSILQ